MQGKKAVRGANRFAFVLLLSIIATFIKADTFSQHIRFTGNLVQLRQGLSDDLSVDLITPKDVGGQPLCLKKESDLKMTWIDPSPGVMWKVVKASLISDIDGEIHWLTNTETPFMASGTIWDLPGDMPRYVDKCTLTVEIVASAGMSVGDGGNDGGTVPKVVGSSTVYVTADTPKSLMSVAWTNVLEWSTVAAHTALNKIWASYYLTDNLWAQGKFDPSKQWFAVSSLTEHKDTFYLRKYLESGLIGRSSDFGDFLACAMMSLGVDASGAKRSYPNSKIMGWPYSSPPSGRHYEIFTQFVKRAGQSQEQQLTLPFHQFAEWGGYYWDGSMKYLINFNWETVKGLNSTTLKNYLVDYYRADIDFDNVADIDVAKGSSEDPWSPTNITIVLSAGAAPIQ